MDDQAMMIALELFEGTREAYRDQWKEDNRKGNDDEDKRTRAAMRRRSGLS